MPWTRIRTAACFAAILLTTAASAILAGKREGDPRAPKTAETQAAANSVTTPVVTEPVLPEGCDPLYRQTSPDGRRVAFVGEYTPTTAGAQGRNGLFVVNLATSEVRQLIEKDLKTTTAWSPDSRKLAIGDSPGYGNIYPLVIVDADTGVIDKTGLAVLDYEAGTSSPRRNIDNREGPTIDQKTWGAIRRAIRPQSERLAALFPKAAEAGPHLLARLCLLAGYSGDERLVEPLKERLDHPDDAVQDAAAIGLGLLGNSGGRARLEAIIARPDPSDAAAKFEADQRKAEAKCAMNLIR